MTPTGRFTRRVVVLVTLTLAAASTVVAVPADAGVVVPASRDLFVVHDSVVLNARGTIRHNLDTWDIEYLGFHGLQAWAAVRFLDRRTEPVPDTVLVALNFNDRSREQLRIDLRQLLERLVPARRIIWVLPGISRPPLLMVRETMLEVVAEDPRVEVVDWNDLYQTDEDLTDLFGVHLTTRGAWVYARMIDRVLDRAPAGDQPGRGRLRRARSSARGEQVAGWALDLGTPDAQHVDLYVGGQRRRRVRADQPRQHVADAFGLGAHHGYRARFGLADGSHRVCTLMTARHGRGMQPLGCEVLGVRHDPIGVLGGLDRSSKGVVGRGWAFDPDGPEPIAVHGYVDGTFVAAATAARKRSDVQAIHPGRTHTGFRLRVPGVAAGDRLCVFAVGQGRGGNQSLGCRTVPS